MSNERQHQLIKMAQTWPDRARAHAITDEVSYVSAAELLKGIKALRKEIEQTLGPIVKKAHAAWKEATGQRKRMEAPLADAEAIVKRGMASYQAEQERIRREEERRVREAARKLEEERRLAEAIAAEEAGDGEAAEAALDAPLPVPVVTMPARRSTPKVAGVSFRDSWKARVVDLPALIRYVAARLDADPAVIQLVQANVTEINQRARVQRESCQIPGVEVWPEKTVAAGTGL